MKKRILTLLLAVCLMTAAFVGTATTAFAAKGDTVAGYLVKYTMQAGDTIYGICEARKINFDAELNKIAKINNITNFNWMFPGTQLWLPSATATTDAPYYTLLAVTLETGDTPAKLCQDYGVDYNGAYNILTALNSNVTTFMAGQRFILPLYVDPTGKANENQNQNNQNQNQNNENNNNNNQNQNNNAAENANKAATDPPVAGDTVQFYLAQHTLQAGETVSGICAAMGIDFGNQSEWIRGINGILDWNNLLPGRTILLPVAAKPTSGSYYQIMAHTVVFGDRVYNLCAAYGLNYYTYEAMLQRLNNRQNLSSFYAGETVYLPMYVPAATTNVVKPDENANANANANNNQAQEQNNNAENNNNNNQAQNNNQNQNNNANTGIPAEDTLSYLIIPHELKAGETVSQICVDLGVDFMANYDRIMQLSNIANYNYLLPGKMIMIPSTTYPESGPYYKVMAHTLVTGDTVYDLCLRYGLNYTNNAAFLQRLNNRDNLSTFYVGQTVYMPQYVPGT